MVRHRDVLFVANKVTGSRREMQTHAASLLSCGGERRRS
jgi:hypothetical protein